jgi:hypothetical protein
MTEHAAGPAVALQQYRDVIGMLHTTELRPGKPVDMPGGLLPTRLVTRQDGMELLQKWVPEDLGRLRPEAYDRLDAEIRACAALGQRYGGPRYPDELPVLVGYNVDVAEPFVLLKPYRGDPVPERRMEYDTELRYFAAGLLRALQHTAEAGVVHGAISQSTVRWNGTTVQLVDFERAQGLGDRRRSGGSSPERSQEQVDGVGTVEPRDDVWAAGLLIWNLSLGPDTDGVAATEKVKTLLGGVFAPTAAERPSAKDLLLRLDRNQLDPMGSSPDEQLAEGRSAFDEALGRKRGNARVAPSDSTQPTPPDEDDGRPAGYTSRTTIVLAVVVVVAIVVVVLLMVRG